MDSSVITEVIASVAGAISVVVAAQTGALRHRLKDAEKRYQEASARHDDCEKKFQAAIKLQQETTARWLGRLIERLDALEGKGNG